MKNLKQTLSMLLLLAATPMVAQEYTTPFNHSLMSENYYDLIVGESSGDRAYYYIMDIAPYERDRSHEDYAGLFMESRYVVDKLKSYGFENATTEIVGKSSSWDGVSAEVWEVSPGLTKLADYRDLAAVLAQGSKSAHLTADLVWVGRGTQAEIAAADVAGKVVVTEASPSRVHNLAVQAGAVGVISFYSPAHLLTPCRFRTTALAAQMPPSV
ncbi:MAG: hypothetical protein IKM50_01625 [Tidjanibacter sp.]|nr:hypothetical protein [Tidjanibacter sp.]